MARRTAGAGLAVLLVLTAAACGGDRKPRLEVTGPMTAAIASAALGDDVDVVLVADEPALDDSILGQLAPIPFGDGPQWAAPPPALPGAPARGASDPAVWLDPDRVVQAARLLADRTPLDVDARQRTDARIDRLRDSMRHADEQAQALLADRPQERADIPTANIRLGYFAERYGLRIDPPASALVPSTSDPMSGLDTDRLGPVDSATATLDGLIIEVARRASSASG